MRTCAQILDCRLWAPALARPDAFARWLASGELPAAEDAPAAPAKAVPAMLRRRLSPLGRAAAEAAFSARFADPAAAGGFIQALGSPGLALVCASRWGDIDAACAQAEDAALGRPLSPARFATSVHNGIEAVLTIAAKHRAAASAAAAGPFSLEAGFAEALGLLLDYERVLLLAYELRAPAAFGADAAASSGTYALALLLGRQIDDPDPEKQAAGDALGPFIAMRPRPLREDEAPDPRCAALSGPSADLEVLRWLLASDAPSFAHYAPHAALVWAKDRRLERLNGERLDKRLSGECAAGGAAPGAAP